MSEFINSMYAIFKGEELDNLELFINVSTMKVSGINSHCGFFW